MKRGALVVGLLAVIIGATAAFAAWGHNHDCLIEGYDLYGNLIMSRHTCHSMTCGSAPCDDFEGCHEQCRQLVNLLNSDGGSWGFCITNYGGYACPDD